MKTDLNSADAILSALGVSSPAEPPSALEMKGYLDRKLSEIPIDDAPPSSKFALGNILVENGDVTPTQLKGALLRQVQTGRRIGEELIAAGHADKRQIDHGLFIQRNLLAAALGVLTALAPAAEAARASAGMAVSVTIAPNAKLRSDYQAPQLKVTAADVARGYVEVPAASRFSVVTNSRSGYCLEFNPVGEIFELVQVGGLDHVVQLSADGGAIVQRGPLHSNLIYELSYRFTLHADAQVGVYPWPLQVSVRAL